VAPILDCREGNSIMRSARDEAALLARVQLMRDTVEVLAGNAFKPRRPTPETTTDCGFVKADPGYYEALTEVFLRWATECPEHAAEQIAETLADIEEQAFRMNAIAGNAYRPPGPEALREAQERYRTLRAQNDRRLGLA
jgi:hypothetical protein